MKKLIAFLLLCGLVAPEMYSQGQVVKLRKVVADTVKVNTVYQFPDNTKQTTATSVLTNNFFVSSSFAGSAEPYFATLGEALDSVPSGTATTISMSNGTYNVSATMSIPSNVIIEGNGAVLKVTGLPGTEGILKNLHTTAGDSNITIRNLTVDVDSVTNTQTSATNAFVFYRAKNVRIENCEVYDNRNYGFYFLGCNKVKLVGCRTRNTDSPYEFRQKTYDVELVNCSSEAGPYQTMGLFIWENCHDINVTNLQISGQGNSAANVGVQILDSWAISIANSNINITGGTSGAGLYLGVDAIGSTDVVSPPPTAHNVEDVQIINSTFTVDNTGFYTLGKQAYWYNNIRLSNVIFAKPSTGDVTTRLFNLQGLNDGLLLDKVSFRDSTASTSPELFYARFIENARIIETSFFSKATAGHKVLLVEPWQTSVNGCTFYDSVSFKTDFYNDGDTRHAYNGQNLYKDNRFSTRATPNAHLRGEQYSDVVGNKFSSTSTTVPLLLGSGSLHVNISQNYFAVATVTDSGYYNDYGSNIWGTTTAKGKYGDVLSHWRVTVGDKGYDWGADSNNVSNFVANDTTRIDTTINSQRYIAEFVGRATNTGPGPNDITLGVSALRTSTGDQGWINSAIRLSYSVHESFRKPGTARSFIDFGGYLLRMGTVGQTWLNMSDAGVTSIKFSDGTEQTTAGAASLDTAAVNGLIDAGTVAVQTSSGYRPIDSLGVLVNAGEELLAQITLDSSRVWTSDSTNMGYAPRAVTVTSIVLFANGTVNVTPRFTFNDTLGGAMTSIITSPAGFTTNRTFVTLSTLNNTAVPAGAGFFISFDSYATIPRTLTARIFGHRTF